MAAKGEESPPTKRGKTPGGGDEPEAKKRPKASSKKAAAKKGSARKATSKKATSKKATSKKATRKKATRKKATRKKATSGRKTKKKGSPRSTTSKAKPTAAESRPEAGSHPRPPTAFDTEDPGGSDEPAEEVAPSPPTELGIDDLDARVEGPTTDDLLERLALEAAELEALEWEDPQGGGRPPGAAYAEGGALNTPTAATDEDLVVFDLDSEVDEEVDVQVPAEELIAEVSGASAAGTHPEAVAREPVGQSATLAEPASDQVETHEAEERADSSPATASTPEDRERVLAAASAYAEMQEARYRVPTADRQGARWKRWIALTGFALAGLLLAAPPGLVRPEPPSALSDAERLQGVYAGLLLQAEQVEAYRAREHRLPDTLDDVAARVAGVRFVRSGSRAYQLIAYAPDGRAVVYDSAAPAPEFEVIARRWADRMRP